MAIFQLIRNLFKFSKFVYRPEKVNDLLSLWTIQCTQNRRNFGVINCPFMATSVRWIWIIWFWPILPRVRTFELIWCSIDRGRIWSMRSTTGSNIWSHGKRFVQFRDLTDFKQNKRDHAKHSQAVQREANEA